MKGVKRRKNGVIWAVIAGIFVLAGSFLLLAISESDPAAAPNPQRQEIEKQETPPKPNELSEYTVPADHPRILTIPKLSIRARVQPLGLTKAGAMDAPYNIHDSGWYTGSSKPGEPGAMMVDAHASGRTREGLFAYLDTLEKGDKIQIERGDNKKYHYTVQSTEVVPLSQVDMQKFATVYDQESEGINLITCTGNWVQRGETYDKRAIVYATRDETSSSTAQ